MSDTKLDAAQVVKLTARHLEKRGYSAVFPNDINTLLHDNRRNRGPNLLKYGRIPYRKKANGVIYYELADIKKFHDRLDLICENLLREKLKRAAAASESAG